MWFRKPVSLVFLIALTAILGWFSGCNLNNTGATANVFMDIRLDESWIGYDSIQVLLVDSSGSSTPEMLFHGPISTIHDLSHVPAKGYDGQTVRVVIIGYKDGKADREVTRFYDGNSQQTLKRDSTERRPQPGQKLDLQPDRIIVYQGGDPTVLTISPVEVWKGKVITWTSLDEAKAKVDDNGSVKGMGEGTTYIRAFYNDTLRDSTLVKIVKDAPILDVGLDTAILFNTTAIFRVKATQAFGTFESFAWDLDGNNAFDDSSFTFPKEQTVFAAVPRKFETLGEVTLRFYIRDGEGNETIADRKLTVANSVPVIDSLTESRTLIVGDSTSFAARVSLQGGGALKSYAWDYEGDGIFEETVTLSGATANPTGGHAYRREGIFKAVFKLTDAAGTSVSRSVSVEVKPDPADTFLAELTLSTGQLTPSFRKDVPAFTSIVPNGLRNVAVYAEAQSGRATVSINGMAPVPTGESVNLVLHSGTNRIHVKVSAENGIDTRTYAIDVTVPPNGEEGL